MSTPSPGAGTICSLPVGRILKGCGQDQAGVRSPGAKAFIGLTSMIGVMVVVSAVANKLQYGRWFIKKPGAW